MSSREEMQEARRKLFEDGLPGDDEDQVKILYKHERQTTKEWDDLEEWQRASWRIEHRSGKEE